MVSSNRLEPGVAGGIRATIDTRGKSGHLTKYITVYSNDRITPVHSLSVSLSVVPKAP
ncbi:MAG TPA: hypothetical protein DCO77_00470 [Nitrospiraceae bacterium]|nr:hypothetical protein [Nitrospiraceae bacterium]